MVASGEASVARRLSGAPPDEANRQEFGSELLRCITQQERTPERSYRSQLKNEAITEPHTEGKLHLYTPVDADRPHKMPSSEGEWWSRRESHPGPVRLLRGRLSP